MRTVHFEAYCPDRICRWRGAAQTEDEARRLLREHSEREHPTWYTDDHRAPWERPLTQPDPTAARFQVPCSWCETRSPAYPTCEQAEQFMVEHMLTEHGETHATDIEVYRRMIRAGELHPVLIGEVCEVTTQDEDEETDP